jgi:hypothetical protein
LKRFPVFKKHVPLEIGIIHALKVEYDAAQSLKFGFQWVRRQLYARTRKNWYKQALKNGEPRHRLDGTEAI